MSDPPHGAAWLDIPLTSLPLSVRSLRCLTAAGYRTFAEIEPLTHKELVRLPGIDVGGAREIRRLRRSMRRNHMLALLGAGMSLRQVGREMGISGEAVRKWLKEAKEA